MKFLLGVALANPARAAVLAGVVVVVIDGDTVLFKPEPRHAASRFFLTVRLAGIDAPETRQPHGAAATRALKALALDRRATLEIVATDRYGRKVGRLRVDALPIERELVRRGHAWASTFERHNAQLQEAQRQARRARRGLWRDAAPTPPWVWRRTQASEP